MDGDGCVNVVWSSCGGRCLKEMIYYDWNDVMLYDARGMFCAVVGDDVFVTDTDTCLEDTEYPNQKP
jgi:hypothetical protein